MAPVAEAAAAAAGDDDDDGHPNLCSKPSIADGFEETEGDSSMKEGWSTDVCSPPPDMSKAKLLRVHTTAPVQAQASSGNDEEDDDDGNSPVAFRRHRKESSGGGSHSQLLLNAMRKLEVRRQEGLYGRGDEIYEMLKCGVDGDRRRSSAPSVPVVDEAMESDRDEGFSYGCTYTSRLRTRCSRRTAAICDSRQRKSSRGSMAKKKSSAAAGIIHGHGDEEHANWRAEAGAKDGCGIPWNWSRRGNSLCCIAGSGGSRKRNGGGHGHTRSLRRPAGKFCSSSSSTSVTEETIGGTTTTTDFTESSVNSEYSDSFPLLECHEDSASDEEEEEEEEEGSHGSNNKYSSQSLSDKYAPQRFEEIVGQAFITQALSGAASRGRVAAMYMFCGPRGTGKTSCARVLAMALNCESSSEESSSRKEARRPCGACRGCRRMMKEEEGVGGRRRRWAFKEVSAMAMEEEGGGGRKGRLRRLMKEAKAAKWPRYRVVEVKECDMLSEEGWDSMLRVAADAGRRVVFVFCSGGAAANDKAVVPGCQKFVFSKIKEGDIAKRLTQIAEKESMEVEAEAVKLVASVCNGSLRDAETIFDQLTLLGQTITLAMAQELLGIVPDLLLLDLLDFALSADTSNTFHSLHDLLTSGFDPSNLISQLASFITRLLAGGFHIPPIAAAAHRRKFFRTVHLTHEAMERLRRALKTLSSAEKHLRSCSDQTTWLAAALLQFAPDPSCMLPSSSSHDTSRTASSRCFNTVNTTPEMNPTTAKQRHHHGDTPRPRSGFSIPKWMSDFSGGGTSMAAAFLGNHHQGTPMPPVVGNHHHHHHHHQGTSMAAVVGHHHHQGTSMALGKPRSFMSSKSELEEVWQRILDAVHSSNLRKFLHLYGKLVSLSLQKGFAMAVLQFCQLESVSRAERSKASIAHAFQVALGCPADVKMQFDMNAEEQKRISKKKKVQTLSSADQSSISCSPLGEPNENHRDKTLYALHYGLYQSQESPEDPSSKSMNPSETTEITALDRLDGVVLINHDDDDDDDENNNSEKKLENAWVQGASSTNNLSTGNSDQVHDRLLICKKVGFATQQDQDSIVQDSNATTKQACRFRGVKWINFMYNSNTVGMDQQLEDQNLCSASRSTSLLCRHTDHEKDDQLEKTTRSKFLWRFCSCMNSKHT